jgi:hypothetical protein
MENSGGEILYLSVASYGGQGDREILYKREREEKLRKEQGDYKSS